MPAHRIRLIETTTMRGHVSFEVEAESAQRAAVIVLTAYRNAIAAGHTSITLPDSQSDLIDRDETVSSGIVLQEIDAGGNVLHQMEEAELKLGMN